MSEKRAEERSTASVKRKEWRHMLQETAASHNTTLVRFLTVVNYEPGSIDTSVVTELAMKQPLWACSWSSAISFELGRVGPLNST
jgi:hypothetical protein